MPTVLDQLKEIVERLYLDASAQKILYQNFKAKRAALDTGGQTAWKKILMDEYRSLEQDEERAA